MITLQALDNAVKFTFDDNQHYLFNGTIEVPLNALTLVTDDSEMATFKKAATNDIFLSCLYSELGMTKSELEAFYKENMVGGGTDEEEVQELIDAAVVNFFDGVEYDSTNSRINFKHGSTVKGYIDAAPFIVDGMVSNVEILNGNLVISFNTDAGKQPISIPLTDIFNPNNYYDKNDVDALLNDKLNISDFHTFLDDVVASIDEIEAGMAEDEEVTASALNDLNERKLDASAYTPTDLSNYYTKSETSGATEISTALASKADTATTYTKTEVDNAITAATSTKQDTLVSGTNIKTINNESIIGSGNITIEGGGGSSYTGVSGITINENNEIYYKNFVRTWLTNNHDDGYAVYWFQGANSKIWINGNAPAGYMNYLRSQFSFGLNNLNSSNIGFAFGQNNNINGFAAGGLGGNNTVNGNYSLGVNYKNKTNNSSEFASGQYNNSVSASTTFGDSGNTLFSVGNGTADNARHNAFEIRQNGDIYISKDGQDVKLQDQLGGGGGSSYTAGDGIDITNDVISVTGKVDTSAITTSMSSASTDSQIPSAKAVYDQFGGLKLVKLTQSEYDALTEKDSMTLYIIVQDEITCQAPSTATYKTLDESFDKTTPIYAMDGLELPVGQLTYSQIKKADNTVYDIEFYAGNTDEDEDDKPYCDIRQGGTTIYHSNGFTANFCEIFGEPMYVVTIPSYSECVDEECTSEENRYVIKGLY